MASCAPAHEFRNTLAAVSHLANGLLLPTKLLFPIFLYL